jgi:hypothetical protein
MSGRANYQRAEVEGRAKAAILQIASPDRLRCLLGLAHGRELWSRESLEDRKAPWAAFEILICPPASRNG